LTRALAVPARAGYRATVTTPGSRPGKPARRTPGRFARRLLGDRVFARVVTRYRAIFVDLDAVADCVPVLPGDRELLDLGGGDGALLDRLLARHGRLHATLVDRSDKVGLLLRAEHRARVRLLPSSSLSACDGLPRPDIVVVADVLHHVPPGERRSFLRQLHAFCGERPPRLVLKDVAPKGWRAVLGLLSDRYVTGDRHVALLEPEELRLLVGEVFRGWTVRETPLGARDAPNYCFVFEPPGSERAGVSDAGSIPANDARPNGVVP
jgi:hypothetical protein